MLTINTERFEKTFRRYSQIGRTDADGLHRLTLTDTDRKVRDQFVDDLESLGLDIRIDEIGNIFARREGTDPDAAPVLIGSHLDSQPYGGRFDGQLGVISGLETLRTFEEEKITHRRPIEIVNWTNEEGSRFKPALMGSGAFVGEFDIAETLDTTDANGVTVAEALERIGYDGRESCGPRESYDSYLELHIEQGPKLEQAGLAVGAVEGVFGMSWLEVTLDGDADHAGPSPMHARNDALVAAADIVSAVRRLSNRVADDVVTTVGELEVSPGSINVVPGESRLTIDVRSYNDDAVGELVECVEREIKAACEREAVNYDLEEIWRIPHTEFSPRVSRAVADAAKTVNVGHQAMVSGAGHDATYLNKLTDAAMVFVPSVDGQTHNEAEHTEWDDAVAGVQTFAEATRQLASRPDEA